MYKKKKTDRDVEPQRLPLLLPSGAPLKLQQHIFLAQGGSAVPGDYAFLSNNSGTPAIPCLGGFDGLKGT